MSKITLTPIELDDGTTNSNNLVNSNKIVVYVPKATEETEGTVKLTDITSMASDLIDAHNAVDSGAHTNKQDKTDNSLNTTSKTVVGAINELDTRLDNIDTNVDNKISQHNQANDAHSDIRTTLSGKVDKQVTSGNKSSIISNGTASIQLLNGTSQGLDLDISYINVAQDKITLQSGDTQSSKDVKMVIDKDWVTINNTAIPLAKNSATTSTTDTYSVDYLNSQFTAVTQVAEGKTTAYTISYSEPNNIDFNSSNNTITLSVSATITDTLNNTVDLSDLKVGDIIYVIETDVPDRWVGSKDSSNIIFYKMETSKPDLSSKVDKTTGTYKLYGTDSSGNQTTLSYDTYPAGSFVRRDANSQITVPITPTANGHVTSKKYVDDELAKKQNIIQYSTMPTASASNEGQIVQFTGTTGTYTNGHFYICVEDDGSYDWEEILYGTPNAVTLDGTSQDFTATKILKIGGDNNARYLRFQHPTRTSDYIQIDTTVSNSPKIILSSAGSKVNINAGSNMNSPKLTISPIGYATYSIETPQKSGTLALTSDIPQAMTNQEIDTIMDAILV